MAPSGAKSSSPKEIAKATTGIAALGNSTLRISRKILKTMIDVG